MELGGFLSSCSCYFGLLLALGVLNGHMGDLVRGVDEGTDNFLAGNLPTFTPRF